MSDLRSLLSDNTPSCGGFVAPLNSFGRQNNTPMDQDGEQHQPSNQLAGVDRESTRAQRDDQSVSDNIVEKLAKESETIPEFIETPYGVKRNPRFNYDGRTSTGHTQSDQDQQPSAYDYSKDNGSQLVTSHQAVDECTIITSQQGLAQSSKCATVNPSVGYTVEEDEWVNELMAVLKQMNSQDVFGRHLRYLHQHARKLIITHDYTIEALLKAKAVIKDMRRLLDRHMIDE